jgi:hypothetical protein
MPLPLNKRLKEKARQEKQQDKASKREQLKVGKSTRTPTAPAKTRISQGSSPVLSPSRKSSTEGCYAAPLSRAKPRDLKGTCGASKSGVGRLGLHETDLRVEHELTMLRVADDDAVVVR